MSDLDHERRRDEMAAYLLGALDPGEMAGLEQHLAGCEQCRTEMERLRPVVQALPESVERVEPSPQLRARVMAEVRADAAEADTRSRSASVASRRPLLLRPAAAVAAIALIAAGVFAYTIGDGGDSGGGTTVVAGKAPGVTARMVRDGDSGTLRLANLRSVPSDEALQAWVQRGDRVERVGSLFVPHEDGTATTSIDDMQGVSVVMVTAEPRSGAGAAPTSAPLVSLRVPQ
jgi:anti-sigma-K factor RskA